MSTVLSQRPGSFTTGDTGSSAAAPRLEIAPSREPRAAEVLTGRALGLLQYLQIRFESRRQELLAARQRRQQAFDVGELPDFCAASADVRGAEWRLEPLPADLRDRRVEIAGPPERKFLINALNAPVQAVMADFEDACSPTWSNLLRGQINLADAIRRRISLIDGGKEYRLSDYRLKRGGPALIVRPRGWHLPEKHVRLDGAPVSAALFDFAVYLCANHELLAANGSAPYFYLPKLEGREEARLWNDVFVAAQEQLGLARGTIKATVLIETVTAAFEMDEILFELREHAAGLSTGRWDYIFSFIKKLRSRAQWVLPDRAGMTMDCALLRDYEQLLIQTCRRRGALAIGGMAARRTIHSEPAANAAAMERVRDDKLREAEAGLDGSWIAYPVLAPIARQAFDAAALRRDNGTPTKSATANAAVTADDLLRVPDGSVTEAGIRLNIRIGVQYLESWLGGTGNVALYHQVEDAATAEICRAQLWQWLRHGARTAEGWVLTTQRFDALLMQELERIHGEVGAERTLSGVFPSAARLFSGLVTDELFEDFMTTPAYDLLS